MIVLARATVISRRGVAVEFSTRRSGRIGGASGAWTTGNGRFFADLGGGGGKRRSFADQDAIKPRCRASRGGENPVTRALRNVKARLPDSMLRLVTMVKNAGLKAKPELGIQFGAGGATSAAELEAEGTKDVGWLIAQGERPLEAGADILMIESEGITESEQT